MKHLHIAILALGLSMAPIASDACSSFSFRSLGDTYMAKSYDWHLAHGYLITNKRNVQKTALRHTLSSTPARWVSRFGSLTFNQYGRELPVGGINEAGLMIEMLWLASAQYPSNDDRPFVNEAQWVQYNLDQFGTLEEVIENADKIRINNVFAKIHHIVCDSSGSCATFEYVDGELVVHRIDDTPVMTNSTYANSLDYLAKYQGFGGTRSIPMSGYGSKNRFVRLAHQLKSVDTTASTDYAYRLLDTVESVGYSQWHLVYNGSKKSVSFRILGTHRTKTLSANLKDFDFSCKTPVEIFDIQSNVSGDTRHLFEMYTQEKNLQLVEKSGRHHGLPDRLIRAAARYPESTRCLEN